MPAPASSTNEAAICATAKSRRRRFVPGVMRMLPPEMPGPVTASAEGRRGTKASITAAATASTAPTQSSVRVDRDIERAHREARRVARQHRHHRPGHRHRQHGAGHAQHQAFGEQGAAERPLAGAERRPHRQFALAPHRPRQNQVGHVRAGHDEDQRRGGQQHQQDGARRRHDLLAQVHGVDAEVGVGGIGLAVFRLDGAVRGAEFGLHVLEGTARAPDGRRARSCGARGHRPSWRRGGAGWSRRWR